jgi:DNA-binding transcriptional ArsR family regulator
VIAHPLRLRLLLLLTGKSYSAAEAARELHESQANVSYHLRRLARAGLVYLEEEASIRGGTAKRYRHDPSSGEALLTGDSGSHTALMASLARELVRRAGDYVPGTAVVFTDAEVRALDQAWTRIQELAREVGRVVHDEATATGAVRISATVALFETDSAHRTPRS